MTLVIILLIIAIVLILFSIGFFEIEHNRINIEKTDKKLNIIDSSIQSLFEVLGNYEMCDSKYQDLNNIIKKNFSAKYSSVVIYNGNDYVIKASNVEDCFLDSIKNVADEAIFSSYVQKNTSKYAIASEDGFVSYKSSVERNIKSVIFSPIYYNEVYLGFWIVEDEKTNAFDFVSEIDMEKFKHNVGLFVENVEKQSVIETAENIDKQTKFYNTNYLYSKLRSLIIKNENSVLTMIYLKNLPEINEKYSRNVGNMLVAKLSNVIRENLPEGSIPVRYSGLRLVILTPGKTVQSINKEMEFLLKKILKEYEVYESEKIELEVQVVMKNLRKQANIEKEAQNITRRMDGIKTVNTIKVI